MSTDPTTRKPTPEENSLLYQQELKNYSDREQRVFEETVMAIAESRAFREAEHHAKMQLIEIQTENAKKASRE